MCEMVRTIIASGFVKNASSDVITLDTLSANAEVLDQITCMKYEDASPGICAVSGPS